MSEFALLFAFDFISKNETDHPTSSNFGSYLALKFDFKM